MKLRLGKFSLSFGRSSPTPRNSDTPPQPQKRGQVMNTSGGGRQTYGAPSFTGQYGQRMFAGAQVSRLTADWPITITSADAEILVSAVALTSRNRQLERDDDYYRQMLWLLENNVVGHEGLKLRSTISKSGSEDKNAIRLVHDAWSEFLHEENFTVMGTQHGIEVERLCMRCLARDGGLLLHLVPGFDNEFGFAVDPIEIDRLDHNWNRPAGPQGQNQIVFGIELDQWRRRVAYHVLARHPGEVFAWQGSPRYRKRIPANQIIYLALTERCGQTKGMPIWPSVPVRLNQLHRYEEAELIAARVAAAKGGWFKRTNMAGEYTGSDTDPAGNKIMNTEPGQWEELPLGFEPVANDPQHPNANYPGFLKGQLRGAAAGSGHPYNAVGNDLEGVNYSSIRAGLLDSRDGYKWLQKVMAHKVMRPLFRSWLPYAIISGKLKLPLSQLQEILAHRWAGRGWPWVDPLKDVQANTQAVQQGFISPRRVLAEDGLDIEEVYEEIEEDKALAESHGLTFANPDQPSPEEEEPVPAKNGNGKANGKPRFAI